MCMRDAILKLSIAAMLFVSMEGTAESIDETSFHQTHHAHAEDGAEWFPDSDGGDHEGEARADPEESPGPLLADGVEDPLVLVAFAGGWAVAGREEHHGRVGSAVEQRLDRRLATQRDDGGRAP